MKIYLMSIITFKIYDGFLRVEFRFAQNKLLQNALHQNSEVVKYECLLLNSYPTDPWQVFGETGRLKQIEECTQ